MHLVKYFKKTIIFIQQMHPNVKGLKIALCWMSTSSNQGHLTKSQLLSGFELSLARIILQWIKMVAGIRPSTARVSETMQEVRDALSFSGTNMLFVKVPYSSTS